MLETSVEMGTCSVFVSQMLMEANTFEVTFTMHCVFNRRTATFTLEIEMYEPSASYRRTVLFICHFGATEYAE